MKAELLQLVQGQERFYPHRLEQQFPRIVHKIIELWDTAYIDAYLNDLMISSRPGRQGFPPAMAQEIFLLSQVREHTRSKKPEPTGDVWTTMETAQQRVIEYAGYEVSPKGFLHSAEKNDRKVVGAFLSGGAQVDVCDERGWTPLMISSFNGNEEIAELLINSGANIHVRDKSGYGPIHWAAFNGYNHVVSLLLRRGADVNAQSLHGWTPLLQAATRGHALTCRILLEHGAQVNLGSKDGWTPLHKACANGHLEVVQVLLAAHADRDAQHSEGMTPIALAIKNKHQAIIDLLLNH